VNAHLRGNLTRRFDGRQRRAFRGGGPWVAALEAALRGEVGRSECRERRWRAATRSASNGWSRLPPVAGRGRKIRKSAPAHRKLSVGDVGAADDLIITMLQRILNIQKTENYYLRAEGETCSSLSASSLIADEIAAADTLEMARIKQRYNCILIINIARIRYFLMLRPKFTGTKEKVLMDLSCKNRRPMNIPYAGHTSNNRR
jgi:hypothetical protein